MRCSARLLCLVLICLALTMFEVPLTAAPITAKVNTVAKKGVIVCSALGSKSAKLSEVARMFPMNFSSNTRVQVLRDQGPEFKLWRDRIDVDWRASDKEKNLTFRWSTEAKDVKSAIWQVTVYRYSSDIKKWETPSGLVASGKLTQVPGAGGVAKFDIDLSQFVPKPGSLKQILQVSFKKPNLFVQSSSTSKNSKFAVKKTAALGGAKTSTAAVKSKPHLPTAMHVVYYVRVIPLNAKGQRTGIPSAPVEICYGDPPPQPYVDMSVLAQQGNGYYAPSVPANAPELNHPDVKIVSYEAIQKDQPGKIYHYVTTANCPSFFGMLKPGTKMDFTPHKDDKSWLDSVGDFFSDAFSFAADAVNWVSTAYDDIKSFAISWAPDELKGVLSTGLDIGLAAMGVPPSIPNFDELTSMGTDYMIKAAADYAGVDPDLASRAVGEFMEATSSQANCGGNPVVWLRPDPKFYYRPAYMVIKVTNNTSKPTNQVTANILAEPVGDKDAEQHGETMFYTACAFIPTLQPGESVSVPVCFEECMPLRWDDHGLQDGLHRFWCRYNTCPVKFSVSTSNSGKYKNRWKMQDVLQLEHAYYGYSG